MTNNYCIVIPHYRHVPQLERFLPRLLRANLPILVIDDGSGSDVTRQLATLVDNHQQTELIERDSNGGKGAATWTGLLRAQQQGYSHIILVDADGQHDPDDIATVHSHSRQHPHALVSGHPQFGPDIPPARLYGREITNILARIEAGNFGLKDAMCGLRVYPIEKTLQLIEACGARLRMETDTELLVRACWQGIEVRYIDTRVIYPEQGASHFRMGQDNVRMALMHARLLLEAMVKLPVRLFRKFTENSAS